MPLPLLPVAIAGAALFLVFSQDKKKKKNGAATAPASCLDAGMPAEFENALNTLLENKALPASSLIAGAMIADTHNFKLAAACLREAAKGRSGPQQPPAGFDPNDPLTWPAALGIPAPPVIGPPVNIPAPFPGGVEDVACVLDPHMGPAEQQQVRVLIASQAPAPVLMAAAQIASASGFPLAAACLTAEALTRSGGVPTVPPQGFDPLNPATWPELLNPGAQPGGVGVPFTIRFGDRPFGLATYYTGQGGRFRELEAGNPQLGAFTSSVPPYPGWQVGNVIMLPPGWNAGAKPLPATGL